MQVSRAVVNGGLAELARQGLFETAAAAGHLCGRLPPQRQYGHPDRHYGLQGGMLANSEIRAILRCAGRWSTWRASSPSTAPRTRSWQSWGAIIDELGRAETPGEGGADRVPVPARAGFVGGNSILPLIYYPFRQPGDYPVGALF